MSTKFPKSVDNSDLLVLGCGILVGLGLRSKYVFGGFIQKAVGLKSMGKGKMCAQCSHASVMAYAGIMAANPGLGKAWFTSGQRKIVVQTDSESCLLNLASHAKSLGLPTTVVHDSGHTQVAPGTKTALSIGPGLKSQLDQVTRHLKLL